MSATAPEPSASPGASPMAERRKRLVALAEMIFDLEVERYRGEVLREYDDVESAGLVEALRVCSSYVDQIDCLPFDDLFVVKIKGIDGHDYIIQLPLHGPGFSLHASRVRVARLSMLAVPPGQEEGTSTILNILDDHSERINPGKVTVDRAFLIGMSMVIGLMDRQGEGEVGRLGPLVQFITPSREEFRELRERRPAPIEAALAEVSKLSDVEQDSLATVILQELASERRWSELFSLPASHDLLSTLADKALADRRAGRTRKLDPSAS